MPADKNPKLDDIGHMFEAFAIYCVETADIIGADQLALFLYSDRLQVRPAFLTVYGHVVLAFLDEAALDRALMAFDEGGPIDDMTEALDEELPAETTLDSENLGAFLGPPLRKMAEAQDLARVVVYFRRDDVEGAMALKYENGRLLGAADRGTTFARAIQLVAEAGKEAPEGLEGIDLTEDVYRRLRREMPEPLPQDDDWSGGLP